ncbi:MAG: hypothetical protein ACT6S0_25995, partial [Roseateles sp.]
RAWAASAQRGSASSSGNEGGEHALGVLLDRQPALISGDVCAQAGAATGAQAIKPGRAARMAGRCGRRQRAQRSGGEQRGGG